MAVAVSARTPGQRAARKPLSSYADPAMRLRIIPREDGFFELFTKGASYVQRAAVCGRE